MRLNLGLVAVKVVIENQPDIENHIKSYFCYNSTFEENTFSYKLRILNIEDISIDEIMKKSTQIGYVKQKEDYPYVVYNYYNNRLLIPLYNCVKHVIIKCEQEITCYINMMDNESLMVPIRIIREIMLQEYENHGAVLVHSSVVDIGAEATLFIGDSGAGKSTIAFYSCKHGANYLANDKCILDQNLNVYSFPMAIRLSISTVEGVMGTFDGVTPRFDSPHDIFFNPQYKKWGSKQKVILSVKEYCRLTNSNQVLKSNLKMLVFPKITPGSHIFEINKSCSEMKSVLLRNITISPERLNEDDWLNLSRITEQEKFRNKTNIVDKLLSAERIAVKFSTDQLEKVYDTIK